MFEDVVHSKTLAFWHLIIHLCGGTNLKHSRATALHSQVIVSHSEK